MGVTVGEILKNGGAPMCFSVLIDASFLGFCGFSFRSGSALHRLMSENKEMSRNECWCEVCGPRGTELGREDAIQIVHSRTSRSSFPCPGLSCSLTLLSSREVLLSVF